MLPKSYQRDLVRTRLLQRVHKLEQQADESRSHSPDDAREYSDLAVEIERCVEAEDWRALRDMQEISAEELQLMED